MRNVLDLIEPPLGPPTRSGRAAGCHQDLADRIRRRLKLRDPCFDVRQRRMTNVSKPTILKLLADLGTECAAYHNAHVRNIRARRIQCDEIWQFVGAKAKNVTADQKAQGWGDVWTWVANRCRYEARAIVACRSA